LLVRYNLEIQVVAKFREMGRKLFVLLIIGGGALLYSCNHSSVQKETDSKLNQKTIKQHVDGTISLMVEKADCYHDMVNPSSNTAEWSVEVSKSGRFDVWLSTATRDTTNLSYKNSVMLSILDNRLEARPACDKIIHNSTDVSYPYFRADSFMGSLYIQDTGIYNIQIISEKILPKDYKKDASQTSDESKLLSVFLTPIVN
jgi:hypothetical protein